MTRTEDVAGDALADALLEALVDPSAEPALRASSHWRLLCDSDPEEAWRIVGRMIERAPIHLVPDVGVGELEFLLNEHAVRLIDRIEASAGTTDRFRLALANVWMTKGAFPDDIEARLRTASSGKIRFIEIGEEMSPGLTERPCE